MMNLAGKVIIAFSLFDPIVFFWGALPAALMAGAMVVSTFKGLKRRKIIDFLITPIVLGLGGFSLLILYRIFVLGAWPIFLPHLILVFCVTVTFLQLLYPFRFKTNDHSAPFGIEATGIIPPDFQSISNIPTDSFNQIIHDLLQAGWSKDSEYTGINAWIYRGRMVLRKDRDLLICKWANWFEGEIYGNPRMLEQVREQYRLPKKKVEPSSESST